MIQRIQSVWLLLSALCAGLSFKFAFYSGTKTGKENAAEFSNLTASSNILIFILTLALAAGCIILIFYYKQRKLQLRLTILAAVISILNLFLYFTQLKKFESGNVSLAAVLTFAIPMFLILAARGIWKDEKLIKSLDRLR